MIKHALTTAAAVILAVSSATAQRQAPELPPSASQDGGRSLPSAVGEPTDRFHDRHTHPHNPAHPTTLDAARFVTDRASPVVLPLPTEADSFSFVVFGDRTGGPDEGVAVLKDAIRDVNLLEPDLVMTVGDLIQGYNDTPEWLEQMNEFKAAMGHLVCPWFPVAGNHDVYGTRGAGPAAAHDAEYELHFGPLWYAFEHKNCWFVVLYSDEGDPATGAKAINNPDAQRMSPEQLEWLRGTLSMASGADHVFVFLHHPRWRGGGYGDDWEKVHAALAAAGNVSAVFAGHIHQMKYRQRDGIEYFTLATVGGSNGFQVPRAGNLHHYNIVTVRKDQIGVTTIPVGQAIDPRELTEDFTADAARLAELTPAVSGDLRINADGSATATLTATIANPTARPVEMMLAHDSADSRWVVSPDHLHATLAPGESREVRLDVRRLPGPIDDAYAALDLVLSLDLLTPAFRYEIPSTRTPVRADLSAAIASAPRGQSGDRALRTGPGAAVSVPSDAISLPDGPMTIEAWFKADRFGDRTGLIAKTEGSDFGLFVSEGRPHFAIHLGGEYRIAEGQPGDISADQWHHIAGVYDGREVRTYLDGRLVASTPATGTRRTNRLPLVIGADVNRSGAPTSFFEGLIDHVRVSRVARYAGPAFTPAADLPPDADTALLLKFDDAVGPYLFDDSPARVTVEMTGSARLEKAGR